MTSHKVFRRLQACTRVLVATGIALSLTATPTWTAELPKRKSGLWELKMSSAQMPVGLPMVETCVEEKADNLLEQEDRSNQACAELVVRRDGDRFFIDTTCKTDKTMVTSHAVVSGRFDSAYRVEIKESYNPPLLGMKESARVIEARWLGPCKPGQKPGDVALPDLPGRPTSRR